MTTPRPMIAAVAAACALLAPPSAARAFVYGEHRAISGEAIARLDPSRAATLERFWALARTGHESRLCTDPWMAGRTSEPPCFDLAGWAAMAGDHACSPAELLQILLEGSMALRTKAIAEGEEKALSSATSDNQRRNASVRAQVSMARIDPDYAIRARANNGHFLLGRQGFEDLETYVIRALAPETNWNSLSNYLDFHGLALILASHPELDASVEQSAARARMVLALESFAHHFLEDMFAAGHVAGSWGVTAVRKGTHDYYNRNGLETASWDGEEMLLLGDSYLTPGGRALAAGVVRLSLEQVLDAADTSTPIGEAAAALPISDEAVTGRSSTCLPGAGPGREVSVSLAPYFEAVVRRTPVPYADEGPGSLPRYRAEIGPFVGLVGAGAVVGNEGGYDEIPTSGAAVGSLSLALRGGLGLEELLSEAGDGLIFLEFGVTMSSAEPTACDDCAPGVADILPRVPARSGFEGRLRLPFWLLPGDLILASPLALFSPATFTRMAAAAANGGLIPYETKVATPLGSVQFVLGRELGATFYGFAGGYDTLVTETSSEGEPELVIVGVRSITLEAPVIEWEPFRSYGARQTLGLRIQLGAGLDMPVRVRVLDPATAPVPRLKTRYFGFLRLVLETRRYF